jgi:endonuclease/exonuclease/phosphatase family metal-dependent hydrolase
LEAERPGHGSAQILPWYDTKPTFYRGNRDTEPRSLLMTRVRIGRHFILFCCTQLATLSEEDKETEKGVVREATPAGRESRRRQTEWIANYLEDYQKARKEYHKEQREKVPRGVSELQDAGPDPVILVGDFNAAPGTSELEPLRRLGLEPVRCDGHTHRKHKIVMDIVFAPVGMGGDAVVIDLSGLESVPNRRISDHHPVIADIRISP